MSASASPIYRPVEERRSDFREVERILSPAEIREPACQCMNCGTPFCHGLGCPLDNVIPEFNAAVAAGRHLAAWRILEATSAFPEFTARVCPALCEGSCTCGIFGEPVAIRQIEKFIVEEAFRNGWVAPRIPQARGGASIAIVGAGPAGLAAADAFNRRGHRVTVYERHHRPGGLLRYGIPDFKLEKSVIDRRLALMEEAGVSFVCDTEVGAEVSAAYLRKRHDAVVLAVGTQAPRDLAVPGRELAGIHFALEFLRGQNRLLAGEIAELPVNAAGRRVLVVGGGDTGADCLGTAIRQGAASVAQLEILPEPPDQRAASTPWPDWPYRKRIGSSHEEAGGRPTRWSMLTRRFLGDNGHVCGVEVTKVRWERSPEGRPLRHEAEPGSTENLEADLVLLALGFAGVPSGGIVEDLGLKPGPGGILASDPDRRIFVLGDCARGAGLVVRAMADARKGAEAMLAQGVV